MCVHRIVAHNIAQNRPDSFPPYPPDNHHCSDDVYLREGGGRRRTSCCISDWKTSATCCITTLTNAIWHQQQQQLHHHITITVRHTGSAATWCNNVAKSYKHEQCFTHYWVYKADIKKLWHAHTSSRVTSSTSYHSDWVNEYSHAFPSVSCQCWLTNEEQVACKNLIHKSKMLQISYTIAEKQLQYQHDDQCPVTAKYPHFSDHSHSQVVASLHTLFE